MAGRGVGRQPRTEEKEAPSLRRAMNELRVRGEPERSPIGPALDRLPCRLAEPPRSHDQAHEPRKIRSAPRADARAAKTRLTDRALEGAPRHSALPLDKEQQLFERTRGVL